MHLKIPSVGSSGDENCEKNNNQEKNCTASIYISQPILTTDEVKLNNNNNNNNGSVGSGSSGHCELEQKPPVLTIQVNQSPDQNNTNNQNLVNIVSCFRAYPVQTTTTSATSSALTSTLNVVNENLPFSISVNRKGNYGEIINENHNHNNNNNNINNFNELANNENNQNIVSCVATKSAKSANNNAKYISSTKATIKCEDLNAISVVDQILISESSNMDYQIKDKHKSHQDKMDLIEITTNAGTVAVPNKSQQQLSTSTTTINQISIIDDDKCIGGGNTSTATADDGENNIIIAAADDGEVNQTANETVPKTSVESQTFREQRRRERRERRQARQRAQHMHHVTTPVHHSQQQHQRILNAGNRIVNGLPLTRNNYEILPDLINNHLPPPYTTLPLHLPPIPSSAPPSSVPPMVPTINVTTSVPVIVDDCRFTFPIPVIRRSPSEHSGRKGCCGQFFQSPKSLGLIAMVALGGVACALGGAALGASGLAGPPTTHLTVSLLMIGIGVVLVTISGVAWRITTSDSTVCLGIEHGPDFEHCGRQQCMRNSGMSHGLLYPEFQHRSPPPSYQASMQEYRLRLLLLDRDRQSHARRMAATQSASQSPPPTYRSNVGTLLRPHRTTVLSTNGTSSIFGLTGIINGAINSSHHGCNSNNRLSTVLSNSNNNINNNSITQLSANILPSCHPSHSTTVTTTTSNTNTTATSTSQKHPPTTANTKTSTTTTTTAVISQQPNNTLLINQNTNINDNDVAPRNEIVSKEINLQMKGSVSSPPNHHNKQLQPVAAVVMTNDSRLAKSNQQNCRTTTGSGCGGDEKQMITILTINNDDNNGSNNSSA